MFFVVALGTLSALLLWPYKDHVDAKSKAQKDKRKQAYRMRQKYLDVEMQDRAMSPEQELEEARAPTSFALPNQGFSARIAAKLKETMNLRRMWIKNRERIFDIMDGCKESIVSTYSVCTDKKMIMLGPLLIYVGIAGCKILFFLFLHVHFSQIFYFLFFY